MYRYAGCEVGKILYQGDVGRPSPVGYYVRGATVLKCNDTVGVESFSFPVRWV